MSPEIISYHHCRLRKTMFVFTIIFLFAVLSRGSEGACTCGPEQWEGTEYVITGGHSAQSDSITQQISNLSYNSVEKKIAMNLTVIGTKGNSTKSHILMDYNKDIMYVVANGACVHTSIATPFPSNCLPAGAKVVSSAFLGSGSHTLETDTYSMPTTDQTTTYVSLSKHCVPIGEISFGERNNVKFLTNAGFSGITLGIKDTSVFNVPAACKSHRGNRLIFDKDALHHVRHIRRKNSMGF